MAPKRPSVIPTRRPTSHLSPLSVHPLARSPVPTPDLVNDLINDLTSELVNGLIALIPEDGSRITNDAIRTALEREAGEPRQLRHHSTCSRVSCQER